MQLSLLYTTFPTQEDALRITRALLQKRLIACGNILGPITSVYMWEGKQEEATEVAVLFKTNSGKVSLLIEAIESLHPYEIPAILELPAGKALPAFEHWVYQAIS